MSVKRFRQTALKLTGTIEGAHQGHADFRVNGRIFATLGYPDAAWGMVKLTGEQQTVLVEAEPAIFQPVPGGWARAAARMSNSRPRTRARFSAGIGLVGAVFR
jgi:hypothetical protein